MIFKFPRLDSQYQSFERVEDLKQKLMAQSNQSNISGRVFKICLLKQRYIYCKCLGCNCKIKYRKDGGIFRLTIFNNDHHHDLSQKKSILQYMKTLPKVLTSKAQRQILQEKFSISSNQYYYLRRKRFLQSKQNCTLNDVIKELENKNYDYLVGQRDIRGLPAYFFVITTSMKQTYSKYGFNIKLDYTFNVIRQQYVQRIQGQQTQMKPYCLAMITGMNSRNKIVIFSFGLCLGQKKEHIFRHLSWVFGTNKSDCDSITSDQGTAIKAAISELKQKNVFGGIHLYDIHHFFRTLKIKGQDKWHLIRKLPHVQSEEYENLLEKLSMMAQMNQIDQLRKIRMNEEKFCISKISNCYIGLSSSTSQIQKVNHLVKKQIPYSTSLCNSIYKLIQMFQLRNWTSQNSLEIQLCPYEEIFNFPELGFLRQHMARIPFLTLVKTIGSSINHNLEILTQYQRLVTSKYKKAYRVNFSNQNHRWQCQCRLAQKNFLPCSHQIRATTNLLDQVGQFWILKESQINDAKKRHFYSRRTTKRSSQK